MSAARNRGAAAASGDVLFFLDSDQALSPDSLRNAVELLDADPRLGCVHGIIAAEPLVDDGPSSGTGRCTRTTGGCGASGSPPPRTSRPRRCRAASSRRSAPSTRRSGTARTWSTANGSPPATTSG
ncbi:glycosyltransferase [Streptomyces lonarensis]|uniref:Glycosyltransferase n=1 Tax=Streptomyces lonarensis TaxID=700599 RepID=A0A7X6HYK7_9ACTN|nr:glycosyltransferase [Streptomyces lonarensis]